MLFSCIFSVAVNTVVLSEYGVYFLSPCVSMIIIINNVNGTERAGAKAVNAFEGKQLVVRGLAGLDTQLAGDLVEIVDDFGTTTYEVTEPDSNTPAATAATPTGSWLRIHTQKSDTP